MWENNITINLQEVGFDVWIELAHVCVRSVAAVTTHEHSKMMLLPTVTQPI